MTYTEPAIHYHLLCFKIACLEKSGTEFQSFFEKIMKKHDDSFVLVKPSGREGDWKSDGYSSRTGTYYQVYAPEGEKVKEGIKKIRDDFEGAKKKWGEKLKGWIFVWSSVPALPPQVANCIETIKSENGHLAIDFWRDDSLWKVVEALTAEERSELLGPVPKIDPSDITAAEIETLLDYLTEQEIDETAEDLDLTDISKKLERNGFSSQIKSIITMGIPAAKVVEGYVGGKHPDPLFSTKVSRSLVAEYKKAAAELNDDSDAIFTRLAQRLVSGKGETYYWPAVGILAYYFELCDIFKK